MGTAIKDPRPPSKRKRKAPAQADEVLALAQVGGWVRLALGYVLSAYLDIIGSCVIVSPLYPRGLYNKCVHSNIPTQTPDENKKWPSAITRLTAHFTFGLMSDLVICSHRKEYSRT